MKLFNIFPLKKLKKLIFKKTKKSLMKKFQ